MIKDLAWNCDSVRKARLSSDDRIRDWGLGIGFGTQMPDGIREKRPKDETATTDSLDRESYAVFAFRSACVRGMRLKDLMSHFCRVRGMWVVDCERTSEQRISRPADHVYPINFITPPRMGGWMGSVSTLGVLCALSFRFRRNHPPLKHHSAQIYDAPQ